ncbi:MAG TPA: hypothetical protein PLD20_05685 [Blastocatellia bacterium]|nr:hypothetical protein [Blastocatellia bacterium]HMX25679.1 hypothetical protein [Blastocatellia bacterium]HMZ17398.1 hypothetical protein [Blastocatellia bacterium]HNG29230.1 hypothetical protein [Blastocatellia bacterium]
MTVEEFNERFPIGSQVNYHAVIAGQGSQAAQPATTRSLARMLANGTAGVKLEGKPGYVTIEAISAISEPLCSRCQAKPGNHGFPSDRGTSDRWYCSDCYSQMTGVWDGHTQ